ncbi:MAG: site-specific integrase [Alphaproteobacteria bacterium]|nr:MAG: site-specific integrase [Alphaproteobacteria bacterium]
MATKRLTDTGIAKLSLAAGTRREIWDTIVPGLGIRVGGRRKTFIAMVRARGRLRRITLGTHPGLGVSDARSRARILIEQAQNGVDPVEAREAKARHEENQRRNTVAVAVAEYVTRYAQPRQRSWRSTQRRLEMYLVEPFGDRPVNAIERADIVRAVDVVQARGFAIGANRTLANFKTFFRWCVERGLIDRSPAEVVRAPSLEISRDRVLSDDEIKAIWKATLSYSGPYGRIVRLLLLTAQRREEVAGLRWAEVDFKNCVWTLRASRTKSARLHVVPLSEQALFGICSVSHAGPMLFASQADPGGDRPFSGWNRAKLRLDKDSGVADWRLHDLRRTAATGMARLGVSPPVIERVLNHATSSAGPLAAVYQRYDYAKEKRDALISWAAEVMKLVHQ